MTTERKLPAPLTPERPTQVAKDVELLNTLKTLIQKFDEVLQAHPSLQIQLGSVYFSAESFQIVFFDRTCTTAKNKEMYGTNLDNLFEKLKQSLVLLCTSESRASRNAFDIATVHLRALAVALKIKYPRRVFGDFSIPDSHKKSRVIVSHGQTPQELLKIVIKDATKSLPMVISHTV